MQMGKIREKIDEGKNRTFFLFSWEKGIFFWKFISIKNKVKMGIIFL